MKKNYLIGAAASCLFSPNIFAATISDLLITEIMANPTAASDSQGEWFELFNSSTESVDLSGIVLSDDGSNLHITTL